MNIKKPTLDQVLEIIKLWEKQYDYHHAVDEKYYVSNSQELKKEFEKYLTNAINKNDPYILIAMESDVLVGFITFEKATSDYFDTNIEEYGEVIELFVDENYRKKGVGKSLMKAVESHFLKQGLKWIELQASTYNKNALIFYGQLGYMNRQTLMFKKIS